MFQVGGIVKRNKFVTPKSERERTKYQGIEGLESRW